MKKTCSLAASLASVAGALLLAACNGPTSSRVAAAPAQAMPTQAPLLDSAAPLPPAAPPASAAGAAVPFVGQPGVGAALRAAAAKNQ